MTHFSKQARSQLNRNTLIIVLLSLFIGQATLAAPHEQDHERKQNHTDDHTNQHDQHSNEDVHGHDEALSLTEHQLDAGHIDIETAKPHTLLKVATLFGLIKTPSEKIFRLHATYESLVKTVHVNTGDKVSKGQKLITLFNKQTLQNYYLTSPSNGEVTARFVNTGDHADENTLLEIRDLSKVWVELNAFPEQMPHINLKQSIEIYDFHHQNTLQTTIDYISPLMTQGHISKLRSSIKNDHKHWRPGMHVKAQINTLNRQVKVAVNNQAIQIIEGQTIVFKKEGDEFHPQVVTLGEKDRTHSEVLSGLNDGDQYVSNNSFVLKAQLLKDGATHNH